MNIGVLLDDLNSREAKIWKSCLEMALSDFYGSNSHYKSRLVLNTRDSKKTVVGAAAAGELYGGNRSWLNVLWQINLC